VGELGEIHFHLSVQQLVLCGVRTTCVSDPTRAPAHMYTRRVMYWTHIRCSGGGCLTYCCRTIHVFKNRFTRHTPDRSSLSAAHERKREVPIGRTNCDTSVIHTVCLIGGYFDRVRMLIPLAMPIITNRTVMLTSRSTEVIRNQLIMTSIGKEYRYCVN
jgi:hypothetical protein